MPDFGNEFKLRSTLSHFYYSRGESESRRRMPQVSLIPDVHTYVTLPMLLLGSKQVKRRGEHGDKRERRRAEKREGGTLTEAIGELTPGLWFLPVFL